MLLTMHLETTLRVLLSGQKRRCTSSSRSSDREEVSSKAYLNER